MATGSGLGGMMTALLPLVGVLSVWRARRRRRMGATEPDSADLVRRQGEAAEMERRMASYLALRGTGVHQEADEATEQEIRR